MNTIITYVSWCISYDERQTRCIARYCSLDISSLSVKSYFTVISVFYENKYNIEGTQNTSN